MMQGRKRRRPNASYYRWCKGEREGDRARAIIDGAREKEKETDIETENDTKDAILSGLQHFHCLLLVVVAQSFPYLLLVVVAPIPFVASRCWTRHRDRTYYTGCYTLCINAARNLLNLYIYIEIAVLMDFGNHRLVTMLGFLICYAFERGSCKTVIASRSLQQGHCEFRSHAPLLGRARSCSRYLE